MASFAIDPEINVQRSVNVGTFTIDVGARRRTPNECPQRHGEAQQNHACLPSRRSWWGLAADLAKTPATSSTLRFMVIGIFPNSNDGIEP
jgi:hypothetical protein